MFGEIVSQIGCPWFPKYVLVDLADSICTKLNCISIALVLFFLDCVIFYPLHGGVICLHGHCLLCMAHLLKRGYGWFPWFGVVKNPPTSASDADDITIFMMLESVRIYPLDFLVLLKFWYPKKKWSPALLVCNFYRYDASLCISNVISLEWNINLVSGFVAQ